MADSIVGRLIYKITGDLSDIKTSLTNAEKSIKKFTKFVQSAAGLFGAAAAFKTLANVVNDFVNQALESEQAEAKLASAMRISGQAAAGQVKQLTGLARALSLVTTYTDEETIGAMTLLTEVGNVSAKGMRELIPLVQDMATGLGMDLNSAATAVSKALAGNVTSLNRLGVQVTAAKDPVTQFNNIVKALTENFGGMSEAMAKSAGGGLKQIRQEFDELKEAVGTRLLQAFKGTIAALSSRIKADVVLGIATTEIGSPEEARAYLKTLENELGRMKEAAKIARAEQAGLGRSMVGSNAIVTEQDKRVTELQNKIASITGFLSRWKEAEIDMPPILTNTTQATEAQAAATKKLADERRKEAQLIADAGEAQRNAEWNETIKALEDQRDFLREQAEERIRLEDEVAARMRENLAEEEAWQKAAADKRVEIEQAADKKIQEAREATIDFTMDLLAAFAGYQRAELDRELDALSAQQEAQLAAFKGTAEQRLSLQQDFEKEKAKLEYNAALKSWQLQLAASIVSGARAIVRTFAEFGWPAGIPAALMQAAVTAIELATIRASKPVPSFSEGGDFTVPPGYPNDSYRMNVESGEHVTVTPAGDGGEPIHVVVNLDGRPILNTVARASRDRRLLIDARSVV